MSDPNTSDHLRRETTSPDRLAVPNIDDLAPDFEARTTHGLTKLSDYRGKWLIFFSHPADFTPVCTSEFIAFQKALTKFDTLDCKLLGLSVDSLYSHIAWVKDIETRFGVKITFPIIEDLSMAVGTLYGMIEPDATTTATMRALYFIDPEGYIRAKIHYPMNVGRSIDEILRVLSALQHADERDISTPAGWQPGQPAMLPPPLSQQEADLRSEKKSGAWYMTEAEATDDI